MESDQEDGIMDFLKSPPILFFISLLLGYPLGFFYRFYIAKKDSEIQHFYFFICGLCIAFINFGSNIVHSMISILVMYTLLQICGGTALSVAIAFIFNMGYLMIGYYYNATLNYSITWTTPQCILCLRLIGLSYDIYDGAQPRDSLSAEQQENSLHFKPSLLQILGFNYHFGGFLVGPQFSMRRYIDLVEGVYLPDNFTPGFLKMVYSNLGLGIFYILLFKISNIYLPDSILFSKYFLSSNFFFRCLIVTVWAKFMLYKYIGCWLISEGVCRLVGLGYKPVNKVKSVDCNVDATGLVGELLDRQGDPFPHHLSPVVLCTDVCANVMPIEYEMASTFDEIIRTFNINTNKWMSRYVFKRCKGLGNRNASHLITLIFLALWHGLYTGYLVNFMLEFFVVKVENESAKVPFFMNIAKQVNEKGGLIGRVLLYVIKKAHIQFVLAFALVSFNLFTYARYMPVYSSLYYCVFITHVLLWPLLYHLFFRKKHTI